MKPLSPFTYSRRHKRRTFLLMSLVAATTLGVCVMVRLLGFAVEQYEASLRYLTRFSEVSALGGALDPGVVAQIRAHPDVARAFPKKDLGISVPLNTSGGFPVFGVSEADLPFLMDACELRLKEGRLFAARANEILLSEEIAAALGLQTGDPVGRAIDKVYHESIPTTMVLVGTLESDPAVDPRQRVRLGLVSYEYLDSHEAYASLPSSLVVIAQKGREDAVDRFLELTIASPRAIVSNRNSLSAGKAQAASIFHLIAGAVDVPIAIVIALVVASINRIALTQRLEEWGLLHAVGYSRKRLLGRLTLETVALAVSGWLGGLAIAWLLFAGLKACVIGPCLELDLGHLAPIWFSLPIPLTLIALATFSVARTLTRFDAVAIIERGKLSIEPGDQRHEGRRSHAPHSSTKPFSAWTFYLRHRRQGLTLVMTMALMTVGVAYPVFLFMPQVDAIKLLSEHLHYVSVVSPAMGSALDPGVAARIRTHPAVADAIPTIRLSLAISMPPSHNRASIYGVSEDDMQRLLDLYRVRLEEGRLPRPRTNEIVVSRGIATNRSLQVGDQVGRPVYDYDAGLPTEMEVVGILSRPPRDLLDSDLWFGLTSYEYLRSHALYSSRRVSLLVIPAPGHKGEVDAWLEESVASEETDVQTYGRELRESQEITLLMALILTVLESVLAIVAAAALAVLSYVFFVQRREEFGTLHAMGYSRTWLVLRTLRETVSAIAVAWLVAAVICGLGLVYVQVGLYGPKSLTVDILNPAPWLFTLPMPLAVVAVSTGLVAWTLSRLDPVSIVERR